MFLVTKLSIPPLRPAHSLVSRPRLLARLNQALTRRLTLVSAPAGFGKTTLLSEWVHQPHHQDGQPVAVAWLSLDQGDNDAGRFLGYLGAALQATWDGTGEAALAALAAPPPFLPEPAMPGLINQLNRLPYHVVLVLDDYHLIDVEPVHRVLALLLDHLPPRFHLVIASRTRPPLPLARLRARQQLLELDTADLRFSPDEAAAFLNQVMGLHLSSGDITALELRTEGWIAGLQLAALSMLGREDVTHFIAAFTGSHRYILDYLVEEVLQRQSPATQTFLLKTSILNRLTGSLCEAVTGQPEGQVTLARLEQANLFIVPLDDDRRWYRYHHLFAGLLRHRLRHFPLPGGATADLPELHRRASEWYERHGQTAEAMGHALSGADAARAIRLVEPVARTMLSRSEMATLLSWLDVLPEELDRSQNHLSLFHAWALVLTGHLDVVEPPEAEGAASPVEGLGGLNVSLATLPGELAAIRATAAYFRRDFGRAVELSEQALAGLAEDNLFLRAALALNLGVASSWTGEVTRASRAFAQAATISRLAGNQHVTLIALWNQGQLELEQGRLLKTAELYRQALELVEHQRRHGQPLSPAAGGAYVGLGCLLYERNSLAEAEQYLQTGLSLAEPGAEIAILTAGRIALSRLKLAQHDVAGAFETVRQAQELARQNNDSYWAAQAAAQQAWLWLSQARDRADKRALQAAVRWAAESGLGETDPPVYLREVEHLALARLLIQQGRQQAGLPALEAASRLLERLRQVTAEAGRAGRTLEVLALLALAYHGQHRPEQALAALDQAFSLARPEGYQRLFLDEGPPMETLLRRAASRGIAPDYVNRLLAAFAAAEPGQQPAGPALVEPLSERELEILHLVAGGRSNQDIARELALTVGTVKWHLNNIYGKLNVRSRTQAVAQARRLKLL